MAELITEEKVAPKRKVGRPRKKPAPVIVPPEWADHSNVNLQIMLAEIPWVLEDVFAIPRGLVSKDFLDKAKDTVSRHYPALRQSAIHRAFKQGNGFDPFFVQIPDWAKRRFDRTLRFFDLIETMMNDGDTSG